MQAAPPLSNLRIATRCPNCHYPIPRDNQPPICPECGKPAHRELTEDDTRLLNPAERAFLKRWRPTTGYASPMKPFVLPMLVGMIVLLLFLFLLTGKGLQAAAPTAVGIAIGSLIARFIANRFAHPRFRAEMEDAELDFTSDHAAICYFDIKHSIIIAGDMHGEPVAFAFFQLDDHQALGFNLDTITPILPDIAHHAPTRLAIEFLPHTGILLNAYPPGTDTIPTNHLHAKSIDLHNGVLLWPIQTLRESITLTDGEPAIF